MGKLHFVAMRALRERRRGQMIVGPPSITSRLGVSSLRIWHVFPLSGGRCQAKGDVEMQSRERSAFFLRLRPSHFRRHSSSHLHSHPSYPYSSVRDEKGDSCTGSVHPHASRFRFAPQTGQSPWQSARQTTFIGMERMTCSVTTSARAIPSPE